MHLKPHFQQLPSIITCNIIQYTISNIDISNNLTTEHAVSPKSVPSELLHVSHKWRQAALQKMFSKLIIKEHKGKPALQFDERVWPAHYRNMLVHQPLSKYVKHLVVEINYDRLFSDWIAAFILEHPEYIVGLSCVTKLSIIVKKGPHYDRCLYDYSGYATANTHLINTVFILQLIAPTVKSTHVALDMPDGPWEDALHDNLNMALLILFGQSAKSSLSVNFWHFPKTLVPTSYSGFLCLDLQWCTTNSNMLGLIHRSKTTLQSLKLVFHNHQQTEILCLIIGKDNNVLTYPNMQKLHLEGRLFAGQIPTRPGHKTAVPFPELRQLTLRMFYPFSDDTLFRGNSRTLEKLVIIPDYETVEMLLDKFVFAGNRYCRLWCVMLEELYMYASSGPQLALGHTAMLGRLFDLFFPIAKRVQIKY